MTDKEKIEFQNETLQRAIDQNGHYKQIDMFTEEAGELLQVLNKMKRLCNYRGIVEKPNKDSSIKYCLAYWGACSELADVKIMICQMEKILNAEAVEISRERKIDRLADRLNNGIH